MRQAIIVAILLAGCSEKQSTKLESQLQILVEAKRSEAVLCAKASEVADAYLREENAEGYRKASVEASTYCAEDAVKSLRLAR